MHDEIAIWIHLGEYTVVYYTFFVEKPMCECQELPASKAGSEGTVQGIQGIL
jgi:hypothetical protein